LKDITHIIEEVSFAPNELIFDVNIHFSKLLLNSKIIRMTVPYIF